MKIATYLINLDGSDERLSAISAALQKHGIAFERVPAVDGRQFDVQALDCYQEQEALSYMGRQLVGGEIGCYLSHLECAKRFLASDSDALVVIEDDMQVDINFLPIIENALRWLAQQHPHWEVINYGNQKMKIATPLHSVKEQGQTFALCHAHYFPMTTTGIVWSRSGAQAFVDASGQIFAPVDNFYGIGKLGATAAIALRRPWSQPRAQRAKSTQVANARRTGASGITIFPSNGACGSINSWRRTTNILARTKACSL